MTTLLDLPSPSAPADLVPAPSRPAGPACVGPAFVDLLRHRHDALCWWDHRSARWACGGPGDGTGGRTA